MVFALRHVTQGNTLILGHNILYSIGRSRSNNIYVTDCSASNRHALLKTTNSAAIIEDKKSKNGTWVNDQKITIPTILENGDIILFGKESAAYVFLIPKFKAYISNTIDVTVKSNLIECLEQLRIKIMEIYMDNCTHYVTMSVSFESMKYEPILSHLIAKKHVITPDYFHELLENIEEAPLIPNNYKHMPELNQQIKAEGIQDINFKAKRKNLFDDILFIFFQEDESQLIDLIRLSGGEVIPYTAEKGFCENLISKFKLSIYVMIEDHIKQGNLKNISFFKREMKKRNKILLTINEDEIYLSILKGEPFDQKELEERRLNGIINNDEETTKQSKWIGKKRKKPYKTSKETRIVQNPFALLIPKNTKVIAVEDKDKEIFNLNDSPTKKTKNQINIKKVVTSNGISHNEGMFM
ncbi:hypothetical protein ABEB36_007616 [Hypothenemus hampei]|uniref:FHA domain-containing protein n=1 Tax=Hypothenemus hampei TaxID=57062 RepID=A0ABD1EVK8_HYPHA